MFPSALGFVEFGTAPLPRTSALVHISSPTTLEVIQTYEHRGTKHHRTLASAFFPDPHTQHWVDDVHRSGVVLILVGDTLSLEVTYPFPITQAEALNGCMAGLSQLAP